MSSIKLIISGNYERFYKLKQNQMIKIRGGGDPPPPPPPPPPPGNGDDDP